MTSILYIHTVHVENIQVMTCIRIRIYTIQLQTGYAVPKK